MLSNSHQSYSHTRSTNIYPITTNFRKEIFLNPKSTLGPKQPSKNLADQELRISPSESLGNDCVQKPRVLEAHESKQFSSGNFQTKTRPGSLKDYHFERGFNENRGSYDPNESSTINKIPFSPIGFKQMKSPLLTINSDRKSDHLSTESSVADSHYASSNNINGLPFHKEHIPIFGSDLKPPSFYRPSRGPQLSIGSMSDIDKRDSFRTPKARFNSDSKNLRSNMFGGLPAEETEVRPNPSVINSHILTSTFGKQNMYHSETIDKDTPPKTSQRADLDFNKGQNNKNINRCKTSHTIVGRQSLEGKKSSTSDELKKYIINLNQKIENFEAKNWIKQVLGPNPRKDLKCSCDANLELDKTCSRALKWISIKEKPENFPYLKNTYEKIISEHKLSEPDHIKQIQKDLHRTFPENKLFAVGSEGINSLERILNALAKYDPIVGYVQSMNFIAASLLYHAEEYIAFWILVSIFEFLEMRDIYLPKLPGLSKHCQMIGILILNFLPKVYSQLCSFQIRPEMFCSEWILTLFSSVVPITDMGMIFDNLIKGGWTFFYKFILAFLKHFEKQLLKQEDFIGVFTILKSQNRMSSSKEGSQYHVNWKDLCQKAQDFSIDPKFIDEMHLEFDNKNLWFRTTS